MGVNGASSINAASEWTPPLDWESSDRWSPPLAWMLGRDRSDPAWSKVLVRWALADRWEMVGMLVSRSQGTVEEPEKAPGGESALHLAAGSVGAFPEMVEALVEAGFDPDESDFSGAGPLHWAAASGWRSVEKAQILLRAGADPRARDSQGQTPDEVAAFCGNKELAEVLSSARRRAESAEEAAGIDKALWLCKRKGAGGRPTL